jgi:hypothetical protein
MVCVCNIPQPQLQRLQETWWNGVNVIIATPSWPGVSRASAMMKLATKAGCHFCIHYGGPSQGRLSVTSQRPLRSWMRPLDHRAGDHA